MIITRPVVGFRSWHTDADGHLGSQTSADEGLPIWDDDLAQARCPYAHDPPDEGCGCGLWANARIEPDGGSLVCGAIMAGGRVVLAEGGFRAQYARPIALLDDESYPFGFDPGGYRAEHIEAVARRRGLPILPADELAAYAAWHGDLLCHPAQADYFRQTRAYAAHKQEAHDEPLAHDG